jgi:hypothetical protein
MPGPGHPSSAFRHSFGTDGVAHCSWTDGRHSLTGKDRFWTDFALYLGPGIGPADLAIERQAQTKSEFYDGKMFAMAGATPCQKSSAMFFDNSHQSSHSRRSARCSPKRSPGRPNRSS